MDYFDRINEHEYLFLRHIGEPEENALMLIVEEAKAGGAPFDKEITEGVTWQVRSIETQKNMARYKIYFRSYIAYAVFDESYARCDEGDSYDGRLARRYAKSSFLDFVGKSSFASADYPGPFAHYAFVCLNHCIDIASCEPPEIERSRATEARSDGTNFVRSSTIASD